MKHIESIPIWCNLHRIWYVAYYAAGHVNQPRFLRMMHLFFVTRRISLGFCGWCICFLWLEGWPRQNVSLAAGEMCKWSAMNGGKTWFFPPRHSWHGHQVMEGGGGGDDGSLHHSHNSPCLTSIHAIIVRYCLSWQDGMLLRWPLTCLWWKLWAFLQKMASCYDCVHSYSSVNLWNANLLHICIQKYVLYSFK